MTPDAQAGGAVERLRTVWRRRRGSCLFVGGLVASVSLCVAAGLPDVYGASATILVEPPRGIQNDGIEEAERRIHRMTEQIQGRERLLGLIERFDLYPQDRPRTPDDQLLRRMKGDMRVETKGPEAPARAVTAFTIRYRGGDPRSVAGVVNELARMYLEEDRRLRGGNLDALSSQLGEMRERLESQEGQLAAFQQLHPGELAEQQVANLAALTRLDALLRLNGEARARAGERRARLLLDLAGAPGAGPEGASAESRLASLRRQLAELRRTYTDRYPDVARLRREIAALEQGAQAPAPTSRAAAPVEAAGTPARALAELEQELRELKDEEQRLRREAASYTRRIEQAPLRTQAYQQMTRDYETTKALYNALLKRHEEAQLAAPAQGGGAQLRLLEPALAPREPIGPRRPQLALLGLVLAVAAAGAVALLAEQLDTSFHSADELRQFTRVPVLAAIPRIVGPRSAWRDRARRTLLATATLLAFAAAGQLAHRTAGRSGELSSLLTRAR
ncbi:MAG: GNVR domain-containing protein [Vicinamibacteria bacterium]